MHTINLISHIYKKFHKVLNLFLIAAIMVSVFILSTNTAFADNSIRIDGLKFDNSDNIVLIESSGNINLKKDTTPEEEISICNDIKKGFLKEPDRAYIDIFNATLNGSSKTYELKNSIFKTVRMSQFQTNPNVVRIVFTYANENNAKTGDFNVIANNKGIIVRYTKALNKTSKYGIVYSNTPDEERSVFFQNTSSSILVNNPVVPVNNIKNNEEELNRMFEKNNEKIAQNIEYKLQSKFYINSVVQNSTGITIKGTGFLSLKPAMFLNNPDRMVIDFDDTVLAKNLRNKTFAIGNSETTPSKETLRLGQNSVNVARIVIQGADAKNYRAVISPDLQNVYIAKRSDVINTKITETQSVIKSVKLTEEKEDDTLTSKIEFNMTEPVAFSAFEENKNFYVDFNNISSIQETHMSELLKFNDKVQNTRLALDKLRIVIPLGDKHQNVQLKASPDAKAFVIAIKTEKEDETNHNEATISKADKKELSISNLYKAVIDAGHGGSDVGATRDGIYEKNITLSIAKMVEKNLQAKKVQTTMTLEKDKTVSLQERCDISNKTKPDVFVSVHVNSSVNDAIYGVETHWWKADSVEYAKIVHSRLQKNFAKWKTKDRGLFKSQFYVINHTEAPAILVEIGFISNTNEREAIITQKRQSEIAKAISDGVMEYLKTRGKK